MQVLRDGSSGKQVEAWQYFLLGQGFYLYTVDGNFGARTRDATGSFQKKYKLSVDGIVGNESYGKAMQLGFELVKDSVLSEYGPNWPLKPDFKPLVGTAARQKIFGKFRYKPAKKTGESIVILDGWAEKNIVRVEIPQLEGVRGTRGRKTFSFHAKAAAKVQQLFHAWEDFGLDGAILTWGGSWTPRFIRGSRTTLSNHAFGTAFDINVAWNYLGTQPALRGTKGALRDLVPIANELGWYWGGHFRRKDGMHFELTKI